MDISYFFPKTFKEKNSIGISEIILRYHKIGNHLIKNKLYCRFSGTKLGENK